MTNIVYAKIAHSYEMAGMVYRSHAYVKLYAWVPHGVPINPEQLLDIRGRSLYSNVRAHSYHSFVIGVL